jgi:ribosomal protein L19E
VMTGRATRQSRQRLLNNLTSRSVGRGQGRRQPARVAREPLTAAGAEAIRTLRVNLDTSTLTTCQAKSKLLHIIAVILDSVLVT